MRRLTVMVATLLLVALFGSSPATSSVAPPTCMGRTVTIMGTPGNDTLVGDAFTSDVIYGDGGDDYISGGDFYDWTPGTYAPPDYLCGGPGDDRVTDGPGSDHLNGGDGNDMVRTYGWGNDVLQGNAGDDQVEDWSCNDCGGGSDILHGNGGNDIISNGWGKDQDFGDAGADKIYDWECQSSTLKGGGGNDYLESYHSSFDGTNCDWTDQYGTVPTARQTR